MRHKSLLAALALAGAFGIASASSGCRNQPLPSRDDAAARVASRGGSISYDFRAFDIVAPDTAKGVAFVDFSSHPVEDGDLAQLELNALGLVYGLNLLDTRVTDAGLRYVATLLALQRLVLERTKITDAGLAELGKLHDLRRLSLSRTGVTDAGLRYLQELPKLKALSLAHTALDGRGLGDLLASRETLEELLLDDTAVDDRGVAPLGRMPRLRRVSLASTRVTDAGIAHLGELTDLQSLQIDGTTVTGAGVAHLARLAHLQELSLDDTKVGEEALPHLAKMTSLKLLSLVGTRLSPSAVNGLRRALPGTEIPPLVGSQSTSQAPPQTDEPCRGVRGFASLASVVCFGPAPRGRTSPKGRQKSRVLDLTLPHVPQVAQHDERPSVCVVCARAHAEGTAVGRAAARILRRLRSLALLWPWSGHASRD